MAIRKTMLLVAGAVAALVASDGSAKSGSHAGVRARSGGGSFSPHHSFHHHRPHAFFFFGSAFGGPFWRPYYPPYYYGPDYAARSEPPAVFVERFDGVPTPQTEGEIFCPSAGAYYPAVTQCPGGWQRVIRPEG